MNLRLKRAISDKFCEAVKMGQTGGLTGVRARGPKSGVFARGHMALSAEINRFVLYLEAPPPPTTRWTPVLAIPGRDTKFRKNDSANGNNFNFYLYNTFIQFFFRITTNLLYIPLEKSDF